MNDLPITNIDQYRNQELERVRADLLNRGVRLDSAEAANAIASANDGIDDRAWKHAYQMSLKGVLGKGIGGVKFIENPEDAKSLGGAYQLDLEADEQARLDADSFARLRADQFIKGMKPIKWDEWKEGQKRGLGKSALDSLIGNAAVSIEGMAGYLSQGGYMLWDMYGPNGLMYEDDEGKQLARIIQHMEGSMAAKQKGAEFARFALTSDATSKYVEDIAGPAGEPVMIKERLGAPAAPVLGIEGAGEVIVDEAGNIGAAAGSIPISLPSMLAPNAATRAVAMAPFAVSGYAGGKEERWQIYKEQVALADQLGIEPPPVPSIAELETWGGMSAAFEVGSEFIGDTAQVGLIKFGLGRGAGKIRRSATSVGSAMDKLRDSLSRVPGVKKSVELSRIVSDSMTRNRGLLGVAKGAAAVAGGGLVEGGEEVAPEAGKQAMDLLQEVFEPNADVWDIDRPFIDTSEGMSGLWLDESVRHSFKVGAYAGILMGGGVQAAAAGPRAYRYMRDRSEVQKGTAFVTESIMQGQEQDAKRRFLSMTTQSQGVSTTRAGRERWQRNAMPTRGSAMAMAHVEQIDAGNRLAMIIDPADADVTLTKDVRDRMTALGIPTKPIGTVKGTGHRIYAAAGNTDQVLNAIRGGLINEVVGSPLMNDGNLIAGMVIMRNAAGQIIEYMPYSDPAQMNGAIPALGLSASRRGLTLDVVTDNTREGFGDIESQIRRQMDADAVSIGRPIKENKPIPSQQKKRGIRLLQQAVVNGTRKAGKRTDPFRSSYLTSQEIGDATNADVTVTVTMNEVKESDMDDGERNIVRSTGQQAVILDPKVVFSIKQKDGTVRTIEKNTNMDGAYMEQVSPDGVFLVRENGTAMTPRTAFTLAMHETRHRTLSRSPNGARHVARLLQIDPVFAMRNGAAYMRRFNKANGITTLDKMNDAQVIAYFRGLHEASMAVRSGTATQAQSQTVSEAGGVGAAERSVRRFAEESVAETANRGMGTLTQMAAEWDGIYADAQERSLRSFSRWMANALVKNGFAGPEAQQALYEIQQRLRGVREEELKIHRRFSDRVSESVQEDMAEIERKEAARAAMRQAGAATAPAPSAAPSTGVSTPPAPGVSPSMRDETPGPGISAVGGDEDKRKIDEAIGAITTLASSPDSTGIAAKAIGALTQVVPYLTSMSAQVVNPQPTMVPPGRRRIPEAMRDVAPVQDTTAQAAPAETAQQIEDFARRQRNAQQAMAIIRGEQPTEPVDIGTVARIRRAQTFVQTPEEEISFSTRERPGRLAANEDVRSVRRGFMRDRGIVPEQEIEDTYAQIDPEFAKRLADWYESTPVNYDDPKMLSAYKKFADETVDQYQYLIDQGYEMIPWAGEGQPYADSEDMVEDLRKNKRVFYYKTVNPAEASSFGNNPAAMDEMVRRNPMAADSGIEVLDSRGEPYKQTYNDLFRAVHDIFGHGAEGFQFGPRGEDNAYRSHAVMFSPEARQAMATETRTQNSWVNFGPNRRNPDGSVWGSEDPRYAKWLEGFKTGQNYAPQKPLATPEEFLGLYEAPQQARASLRPIESINIDEYKAGINAPKSILNRHIGKVQEMIKSLQDAEYPVGSFVVATPPTGAPISRSVDTTSTLGFQMADPGGVAIETMDTYKPEMRIANPKIGDVIGDTYKIVAIKYEDPQQARASLRPITREEMTPAMRAGRSRKVVAAQQEREQSKIARDRAKKAAKAVSKVERVGKPATISVSTAPTASPMVSPNIIMPSVARDKAFSQDEAYRRVHARIHDLVKSASFVGKINSILRVDPDFPEITKPVIRSMMGNYLGRNEETLAIDVPGLTHEQSVRVAGVIGSLLLQEASITTSEATESTPAKEQAAVAVFVKNDGTPMTSAELQTVLGDVGNALGGASEIEGRLGVYATHTQYGKNPIRPRDFSNLANAIASRNGLTVQYGKVRSTYTKIGAADVLGGMGTSPSGRRKAVRRQPSLDAWRFWVEAAASIVEELRDEGFDIDIPGWISTVAGPQSAEVQDLLIAELARNAESNKNGLDARLNQRYEGNIQGMTPGAKITAKTNAGNAQSNLQALDEILARHPAPFSSIENAGRFFYDLFGSRDIPVIPKFFVEAIADNFAKMRKDLSLRENGGRLTGKMVDDAIHGMQMAQKLRALYAAGKARPEHTVMLAMWGFMSRGVSPYIQESLFLDIVNFVDPDGKRFRDFVNVAMSGTWTKETTSEWSKWIDKLFDSLAWSLKEESSDQETERNGSPGSGAKHNANAFGRNFLANIAREATIDGVTKTGLRHFHDAMASPTITGRQVRRIFNGLGGSLGIDNKVVGFAALVAGKTDVSVYDRVRVGDHFNRDGAIPNAYDGFTVGYGVYLDGVLTDEFYLPMQIDPETYEEDVKAVKAKADVLKEERSPAKIVQRNAFLKKLTDAGITDQAAQWIAIAVEYQIDKQFADPGEVTDEKKRKALMDAISKRIAKWKDKPITTEPIKIGGLANLFNGVRGLALYEAAENSISPNDVFADLMKSRPDIIPYVNHGLEHWLNWVGASGQEASHKTLDGLIEMISSGADRIEDVYAKEGRYDTYAYGAEYGYDRMQDGSISPRYRYEINGKTFQFTSDQWGPFLEAVSSHDYMAEYNASRPKKEKKRKFKVSEEAPDVERTTPWLDDPMVGQNGKDAIEGYARKHGTMLSMRDEEILKFGDMRKMVVQLSYGATPPPFMTMEQWMEDTASMIPSSREYFDMARIFAARNIAPTNWDEFNTAYRRLVEGKWKKPTHPNFIKYWDRDNALNGLQPNDIWWHGTRAIYTKPDPDRRSNTQFGWHCGNFHQASDFTNKSGKFDSFSMMFPVYVRATKAMELEDKGDWTFEGIALGMQQYEYITESDRKDLLTRMYREIGIREQAIPDFVDSGMRGNMPSFEVSLHRMDPMFEAVRTNIMRSFIEGLGYDAIRYQNYIEGKALSPYTVNLEQARQLNDDRLPQGVTLKYKTPEQKEYETDFWKRYSLMGSWIEENPKATKREQLEAAKQIRGDKSSLIIWKPGQVKAAVASDVGFDTTNWDILASLRIQPPAVVSAYSNVFIDEVSPMLSMRDGIEGARDEFVLQRVDKYDELRRYGEQWTRATGVALPDIANPFQGARVLTGRLGAIQRQSNHEYANILRDMHEHDISLEDMDDFLTAQHALNGGNAHIAAINPAFPDGGTGMTNAEAVAVLARANAAGRYGEMNRIANDWRMMLRAGLIMRRDSGLITNDQYNTLTTRYTHYVPLRGAPVRPEDEAFEDFDAGEVFGRGLSTQGRGMPNRLGRRSRAQGVTAQVGMVHEDTIARVERNAVGQRLLRLVQLVNDPNMAEVVAPTEEPRTRRALVGGTVRRVHNPNWMSDPRNFGVYINQAMNIDGVDYEHGDLVVIRLNNPRLVHALNTPDAQLAPFEEALRHANNAWRFMTTGMGNPTFAPVNLIRDVITGSLTNAAQNGIRDTASMLARYPGAFLNVFSDAWLNPERPLGAYRRFIRAGGDQVSWRPNDLESKQTDFAELADRVARRDPADRSLARNILGWYGAFFTAAETATRVAHFEQRRAAGDTDEQAAFSARNLVVDFGKGGKRKPRMNTWYMFINASIQGSVNVAGAVTRSAALAPSLITFGMATALLGRALGGDDEETGLKKWDLIPDYIKSSNIVLMDPTGSGRRIQIPMGYGYNVFVSAGQRIVDAAFGPDTVGDAVGGMVVDALNAFNPMGGSGIKDGMGSVVSAFVPTMLRPAVEIPMNRNWMGRPIYPEAIGRQKKTDAYSYFDRTPEGYVEAAQAWNALGGGDMFEAGGKGFMDVSPNTLQYLVGYYMSGSGRLADRLYNLATTTEPIETADIPLVRNFYGDATDTRALSERYDRIASGALPELYRAQAIQDERVDIGTRNELASRPFNENRLALAQDVEATDKQLKQIRKEMRTATPEQRERLVKAREAAMKYAIRRANELQGGE